MPRFMPPENPRFIPEAMNLMRVAKWLEGVPAVVCRVVVHHDEIVRRMRRQQQRPYGQERVIRRAVVQDHRSQPALPGPRVRSSRVRLAHGGHVVFEGAHRRNALPERFEQCRVRNQALQR